MKTHTAMTSVSVRLAIGLSLAIAVPHMSRAQQDEHVTGAPAERTDAAEVRAQIASIEKLLPTLPDRGAALYVMAALKHHLGETREALQMLKGCIDLREG